MNCLGIVNVYLGDGKYPLQSGLFLFGRIMERAAMLVTDEQVDALRAYLTGDFEGYRRRWDALDPRDGYAALLACAFSVAVRDRFPPGEAVLDDVLDFVGTQRFLHKDARGLPPGVAERLIWSELRRGQPVKDIPFGVRWRAIYLMLYRLIDDLPLSGQGLGALLAKARDEAGSLPPASHVADEDIAALRALLSGDSARFREIRDAPGRAGTKRTWVAVLLAAFTQAVYLRFGADAAREEVAAYVADVRGRSEAIARGFTAYEAEQLIMMLVSDAVEASGVSARAKGAILIAFTVAVVSDARLDDLAIEAFLAIARRKADQWHADHPEEQETLA